MPDIMTITAFISSIKNATDIAKAIREAGLSLEKAETKLKMAELIAALADAKIQAAEIQELIQEKDRKIAELGKAFELTAKLARSGDAYYETDENGNPIGDPYCSYCWERNHITVHLHTHLMDGKVCPNCKNHYDQRRASSITKSPAAPKKDAN